MPKSRSLIERILDEQHQGLGTRVELYKKLERELGRPIIAFYYNFETTASLEDIDVDFIEEILRNLDLSNGLVLIINCPGGDILAAERMIKALRSYCGNKGYFSIVPKMAMSAATLVCLGSSKIIMSPTSSLGPIDPQIHEYNPDTKRYERYSVFNILKSYSELFNKALKSRRENLEPYLQALETYKPKVIEEYKSLMELSKDICVNVLKSGMLQALSEGQIKNKIKIFLTPEVTKIHERCIYPSEALKCGLTVETIDVKSKLWEKVSELHLRLNAFLSDSGNAIVVETKDATFVRTLDEENDENNS